MDGLRQTGCCIAAVPFPPRDRRGIAMTDPSSTDTSKTDSSTPSKTAQPASTKKPISPARHGVGLVILIAVLAFGWLEYSAKRGFNRAVDALNERTKDEEKELLTVQEAESLLGKQPDGPATDAQDGGRVFSKRTYTWRGVLRSYPLIAFYTKEKDSRLHHYETEGAQLAAEPPAAGPGPAPTPAPKSAPTPDSAPAKTPASVPAKTP
jgi:hypothetical protein